MHAASVNSRGWTKWVSASQMTVLIFNSEHDEDNYKSEEDPDFVAPDDIDHVSDGASSADDESSDAEEKMQE